MSRRLVRLAAAAGSLLCLASIAGLGGVLVATETEAGRAFVRERMRDAVSALLPKAFDTRIGGQHLTFEGGALAIRLDDLGVSAGARMPAFVSASRVTAWLDPAALLAGRLAVSAVEAEGVVIDEPAVLGLFAGREARSDWAAALDSADEAMLALGARARRLGIASMAASGTVDRGGMTAVPFQASLTEQDRHFALVADGRFEAQPWRLDGRLAAREQGEGDAILAVSGSLGPRTAPLLSLSGEVSSVSAQARIEIRFAQKAAAVDLVRRSGEPIIGIENLRYDSPDLVLEGLGMAEILDDDHVGIDLTVRPAGDRGSGPTLDLDGTLDIGARRLSLEAIEARDGEEHIAGSAHVDIVDGRPRFAAELSATDLSPATLKRFWPALGDDAARAWVRGNVADEGRIGEASLTLRSDAGQRGGVAFDLAARFSGASTKTVGDLPQARDIDGTVVATNGRTDIAIAAARLEGADAVTVRPTTLRFTAGEAEDHSRRTDANLSLELSGPLADLAAIADRAPVSASARLGRTLGGLSGAAELSVGASFVLGPGIAPDKHLLGYSAIAVVEDAGLAEPVDGRRITEADGLVTLSPGQVTADVEARIDGLPARITASQPFGSRPVGTEELTVAMELDAGEVRRRFGLTREQIDGPISAELRRTGGTLSATVDLTRSRLGIPWIGWSKGAGVPARLAFDVEREADGDALLRDLALTGQGFGASGSMVVDGAGVQRLDFGSLFLNEGDDASLAVRRARNGYSVEIAGRQLDARSVLNRLLHPAESPDHGAADADAREALDLSLTLDELRGFNGAALSGVALNVSRAGREIVAARLDARDSGGGAIAAQLSPNAGGSTVSVQAGNLGGVLRFLGLYERMEGGKLALALNGTAEAGFSGEWVLRDFALVDEPRLARIVGEPRTEDGRSLADLVDGELPLTRAGFDVAEGALGFRDGRVRVADGVVRGEAFGSSFEGLMDTRADRLDIAGSFMPAYSINRVFGAVPLVGGILGNGNEGGLIGITYRLAGPVAEPTLTVNPISLIAPGIFRRIFAY